LKQDVTTAAENYDLDLFMKTVTDYDSLTKIDPFVTSLLLKAKKMVSPEGSDIPRAKTGEDEENGEDAEEEDDNPLV
jgi:hypothetical protein